KHLISMRWYEDDFWKLYMDHNCFYITVSKTKVVLAICFIQLIQVEMKCYIDHRVGNEEIPSQKQHFHGI
ncbi:MAG: hypothetical protein ACK53Y_21320, partial [bacterium]